MPHLIHHLTPHLMTHLIHHDERLLHKVQDIRADMPVLSPHVHAQTANFHGRIVAPVLAMREGTADPPPRSLVRLCQRNAVVRQREESRLESECKQRLDE